MKQRCLDPKAISYPRYGGLGIKFCDEWRSFANFLADMGERPQGKSLDRIDPKGDYCKENCRWADIKQQANNRTNNRYLTHKGITQSVSEWAQATGLNASLIIKRVTMLGWAVDRALTQPAKPMRPYRKLKAT